MYIIIMLFLLFITFFISRKNASYRIFLITVNTIISLVYILWRITVIPIHHGLISFILGVTLYLAELLGLVAFFNFQYLFAVLDADMIPKKEFLQKTVGYFSDDNMAFVQTPQVYYNQDIYQYNLGRNIPNEQDFFMRDIQEARASRYGCWYAFTRKGLFICFN